MHDVLEFFSLKDAVPLILLICLLRFVGGQIAGDQNSVYWWARGFAAAGFLFYAGAGIAEWEPRTPGAFLTVGLQALLAMGTAHGLALVTLPVLRFLYLQLWAIPMERQRVLAEERARSAEKERQERLEAARQREASERQAARERRNFEEVARRPPPPTREERMEAAKQRFEKMMRSLAAAGLDEIELKASQERAKQQYLRELDETLQ